MYTKQLIDIGLTPLAATIYEFLALHGASTASHISRQSKVQRSMVYIILKDLKENSLVLQDDSKKVARFLISNPDNLERLINEHAEKMSLAESAYLSILDQLKQQFAVQSGQPGVRFYIGLEGLKRVYADINSSETTELWIIRSRIKPSEAMLDLIREQRAKQIKKGVKVRVINSTEDADVYKILHQDEETSTERRVVAGSILNNPAQLLIYGNKIALTTYSEPMMTTVIEHVDIATTLRSVYSIIWQKTLAETQTFLKKHGA